MKDDPVMFFILIGIVAIALFGGIKGGANNGLISNGNGTPEQKQANIQQQITDTQRQVDNLKQQIQIEEDKKTHSEYYGKVNISFVSRSSDPKYEYVALNVGSDVKSIPVTGWTLKSLSSGESVTIPNATYLYFTASKNSEENIYVSGGNILYIVTGSSPNGVSFRTNKCSGYLGQFQTYVPYLSNTCPAPRDENLSSIPKTVINDACLDYIESMPSCRVQTEPLPINWSTECKNFINTKLNYQSCVDTHKNDPDFYKNEWLVYLRRDSRLWKDRREDIVLYDLHGKIVAELKY